MCTFLSFRRLVNSSGLEWNEEIGLSGLNQCTLMVNKFVFFSLDDIVGIKLNIDLDVE